MRALVPEDLPNYAGGVRQRSATTALIRACAASLMAANDSAAGYPSDVVTRTWPGDSDAAWLTTKAAVSPATAVSIPALLRTANADFLGSLGPASAGAQLLERGIALTFDGAGAIRIPHILADASGVGFVSEAAPIAVRQLSLGSVTLTPRKFATISTFTGELFAHSIPNVEKIVRMTLTESVGLALDEALFATTAGDATRPPGLRNGISALTPSAATPAVEAMIADVSTLVDAVAAVAGNSPIVLIAAPSRAARLRLRSPQGFSLEVLASDAIASDELIAVATNAIASATDPTPRFDASTETLVHQEDTTPLPIVTGGVVASPTRSLWQSDVLGLRLIMEVSWGLRHPSGLAWLDNITAW